MHAEKTMKENSGILQSLLKSFSMFNISIQYDKNTVPYSLGIKCIQCNKVVGYELYNQTVKDIIAVFVTNVVFWNVGIYWIIESKEELNFCFEHHCINWVLNGTYYNTKNYSHLHGSSFEDYFTTS